MRNKELLLVPGPTPVMDEIYAALASVIVAGSLAHLAGKAFRIGHMGNTTADMLEQAVRYIGEALVEQDLKVNIEAAVAAFQKELAITL